jgi:hypothetical protein
MDPITGVIALTGLTVAAVAGLRLQKASQEGFETLPSGTGKNSYINTVEESQTRYNALMSMVDPVENPLIPVGATAKEAEAKQNILKAALGNVLAPYDPASPEAFRIKSFLNRYPMRTEQDGGLYEAIRFCREAAKADQNPFTSYKLDSFGNKTDQVSKAGQVKKLNEFQSLKFDEICGVCLTSGVDEDGKPFNGRRGMLVDPSSIESAMKEQRDFSYPFARVAPSLGKCEGAPNTPAFAVDQESLDLYVKRMNCMKTKEINETNNCGLCYENDTFSYVPQRVQKNTINIVLMGLGKCNVSVKNISVKNNVILSNTTAVSIPLILNQDVWTFDNATRRWKVEKRISPASEGDTFTVEVSQDPDAPDEIPIVYGYMASSNPNGGQFALPLNIIFTRDAISNSAPNRTGGFYAFPENGVEVAKIRPGGESGRQMRLQGDIPFTFVQANEFSGIDCPTAPYQTKSTSVTSFASDQPCYAKGSKPGSYNDACLRERILDVGCTNNGDLYKNPSSLNRGANGTPNSLTAIYNTLSDIAANNMIDADKTKLCSGNVIVSPCEIFKLKPNLKMEKILNGSDKANSKSAPAAKQCLSYLYNNKGAQEQGPNPPTGPTYSGLSSYSNTSAQGKNLFCLPAGELNPDTSNDSLMELARIFDMGFKGAVGIDGVKKYLTSFLEMAIDERRNGNTDPDRRAAIRKCFGTNFNPLQVPSFLSSNPSIVPDPPKYIIKNSVGSQWSLVNDMSLRLGIGTPIEVEIVSRSDLYKGNQSRVALFINGDPSKAIRALNNVLYANPYTPLNADFAWYLVKGTNNTVYFHNDYNNGSFLGFDPNTAFLVMVPKGDKRIVSWSITPYPSNFVKDDPALLYVPTPQESLPSSFIAKYNTKIGFAQNNGDYILTMNLIPRGIIGDWASIVHFTITTGNCCGFGDRAPAIFFFPGSLRLHVRIGDFKEPNWGVDPVNPCRINQVNTFRLECRGSDVTVTLNNEVIKVKQPVRRPTGLATVWGADPWYPTANTTVSNFKFTALN